MMHLRILLQCPRYSENIFSVSVKKGTIEETKNKKREASAEKLQLYISFLVNTLCIRTAYLNTIAVHCL